MLPRAPILISFSGIDGAGKSTQIAGLYARLLEAGLRIRIFTFWDDVVVLKGLREGAGHTLFGGDAGVGTPEAPLERKDKNVRSPAMTVVRLFLYLLDALAFHRIARRVRKSTEDVIIFDRCPLDELANLHLESAPLRLYARFLMRVATRPHISFFLDADPEQARARKPEYPLAFLRVNRQAYLRLSALLGGVDVIAPGPIGVVGSEIANRVFAEFAGRERGPELHQ